jgi:hypothetical protein
MIFNGATNEQIKRVENKLANYLPKTGGELTTSAREVLTLARTVGSPSLVFKGNGSKFGEIGFDGADRPTVWTTGGSAKKLIHEGNVASYALPLTGSDASTIKRANAIPISIENTQTNSNASYIGYRVNGAMLGRLGFSNVNKPVYVPADGQSVHVLLHTGNVGSHAAKVESGTFNLTFTDSSGNTVFTIPNCYYHKVGSHVFISGSKQNVTGAITFTAGIKGAGLPFTPAVNGGTGEMVRVVACSADKPVAAAIKEGADITYNLQTGGIVANGTLEQGKTLAVYGLYMTNA